MKLTAKLVVLFVLLSVIITAANGYITVQRVGSFYEGSMELGGQQLAALLERSVLLNLDAGGEAQALRFLEYANRQNKHTIIRWVWFDSQAHDKYTPRIPVEELNQMQSGQKSMWRVVRESNGRGFAYTYRPVAIRTGRHGGIELTGTLDALDRYVGHTNIYTFLLMGIMLLFSGIMVAFLGINVVGRPLQQLIEKTRRAGTGDLTGNLYLGGNDELTELAQSLNSMCLQLSESQEKVRAETTARISALEQLRHADRLHTVGRLASGIAHELGTPLNVISGRAGLIASGKLTEEGISESAQTIKAETDRMAVIIRQLLDFARRRTPQRVSVDLRQIVDQTIKLMAPLANKRDANIVVFESGQSVVTSVDVGQLQQVLTNLTVNAVQAMPNGGVITIDLGRRFARPPEGHDSRPGNYDYIDVKDNGNGISEEVIDHIFEPFFTTKEVGEGTGLGLSLSYGIIKEHGGWISASSEPNRGTCFSVYLPSEGGECSDES